MCFAAAAAPALHLFFSHQSGVDDSRPYKDPPRLWQRDPARPLTHTCTPTLTTHIYIVYPCHNTFKLFVFTLAFLYLALMGEFLTWIEFVRQNETH